MNELIAASTFVLFCFVTAFAARHGLKNLYVLSALIILASNVTVGIQVDVLGFPISLGVVIYSVIYLVTDVVSEFYERHEAYRLAATNVVVQVIFWVYIYLSVNTQASGGDANFGAMETLFSSSARITVAALVASVGAFVDIAAYEWLMRKAPKTADGARRHLWLRNILSTCVGQALNTALFFGIALYGVVPNLLAVILSAIGVKWAIAVLDTPFLYWTRQLVARS